MPNLYRSSESQVPIHAEGVELKTEKMVGTNEGLRAINSVSSGQGQCGSRRSKQEVIREFVLSHDLIASINKGDGES